MTENYRRNWNPIPRKRIDARPPSPEKAAGVTRLHYGMDGSVIGGVTKEGIPYGTRARQGPKDGSSIGNPTTPGLDRQLAMNSPTTSPATGERLAARQALHAEMVRAGRSGITPEMQARATALGVTGPAWLKTSAAIQEAPGMLALNPTPTPNASAAGQPSPPSSAVAPPAPAQTLNPTPEQQAISDKGTFAPGTAPALHPAAPTYLWQPGVQPFKSGEPQANLTPQLAANTPGPVPPASPDGQRINRLTGRPFGYNPNDPEATKGAVADNRQHNPILQGPPKPSFRQSPSPAPPLVQSTLPVIPLPPKPFTVADIPKIRR